MKLELLKASDVLFCFLGSHVDRKHIEAFWTSTLPIRRDRAYARTRDAVFELPMRSFRDVTRRLPSEKFWPAFETLWVNVDKVKWLLRNGTESNRTTHVKRLGFAVVDFASGERAEEWVSLGRDAHPRFTRYFDGR